MDKFKCKDCDKSYETLKSLSQHRFKTHHILPQQSYNEYVLSGKKPTCLCGCGEEPKFLSVVKGYREYRLGHAARINNNWGHNPEAIKKSHDTQREMYENGELIIWNKGLTIEDPRVKDNIEKMLANPERGDKISEALTGVAKSEKHRIKLSKTAKERWSCPIEREKQSHKRLKWMRENDYTVKSKTEELFNEILINLGLVESIDYERQFYIRDIKGFFDFYLYTTETLIEVDGDFWHCNPTTKFKEPKFISQFKNLEKDKIKNEWSETNGVNLIRFWEYDINNNLEDVTNKLKLLL